MKGRRFGTTGFRADSLRSLGERRDFLPLPLRWVGEGGCTDRLFHCGTDEGGQREP